VSSVTVRVPYACLPFRAPARAGTQRTPIRFRFRPKILRFFTSDHFWESRPLQLFFNCPFPLFYLCIQFHINHKEILQQQMTEHHTSPQCCSFASHPRILTSTSRRTANKIIHQPCDVPGFSFCYGDRCVLQTPPFLDATDPSALVMKAPGTRSITFSDLEPQRTTQSLSRRQKWHSMLTMKLWT
jgi:hypothetical protein